jgi:hypothetical protein
MNRTVKTQGTSYCLIGESDGTRTHGLRRERQARTRLRAKNTRVRT